MVFRRIFIGIHKYKTLECNWRRELAPEPERGKRMNLRELIVMWLSLTVHKLRRRVLTLVSLLSVRANA